jgi:tetratricopeptide (TPR) repeat protein
MLLTDLDEPTGELTVRADLALALLHLGEIAEAAEHIKHAMSLGDRVKGPQYTAYVLMTNGILLATRGEMAAAADALHEAVEGLRTLPFYLARALAELGMVYHHQGDPRAGNVLQEAIEVAERVGEKGVAARVRAIRG